MVRAKATTRLKNAPDRRTDQTYFFLWQVCVFFVFSIANQLRQVVKRLFLLRFRDRREVVSPEKPQCCLVLRVFSLLLKQALRCASGSRCAGDFPKPGWPC